MLLMLVFFVVWLQLNELEYNDVVCNATYFINRMLVCVNSELGHNNVIWFSQQENLWNQFEYGYMGLVLDRNSLG